MNSNSQVLFDSVINMYIQATELGAGRYFEYTPPQQKKIENTFSLKNLGEMTPFFGKPDQT